MIQSCISGTLFVGIRDGYDFVVVRDIADGMTGKAKIGEHYIMSNRHYSI